MTAPCPGRVPSLPSTAPPAEVVRDHPWPGFALWRGRFWSIPKSPTSPRYVLARGGVGPTPARGSTPGAGRATTTEVEGARRVHGLRPAALAIPRWSWALVDRLGRFVRERWDLAVIVFFAVAVPVALGLAMWLAAERRGVAW